MCGGRRARRRRRAAQLGHLKDKPQPARVSRGRASPLGPPRAKLQRPLVDSCVLTQTLLQGLMLRMWAEAAFEVWVLVEVVLLEQRNDMRQRQR